MRGNESEVEATVQETGNASSVPALVAGLGEMQSLMVATEAIDEVVWETAMLAVRAHEAVDGCGVTVLREGRPHSLCPETEPYAKLEEMQYSSGIGPAVHAMTERTEVEIAAMSHASDWGEYAAVAAAHGIESSLSLPLVAGGQVLGAINYYAGSAGAFSGEFVLGRLIADLAATGLWCMLKHADRQQLDDQLRQALTSRADIDQAKGILMAQQRCSPEDAFDLLRRASQNRNVKLRDIARDIVEQARSGTDRQ